MKKQKKICCRITPRRVMGAVLLAASALNLIIVGAVFEASPPGPAPTTQVAQTASPVTMTFFAPTATEGNSPPITLTASNTPTETITPTFTATQTETPTATNTPSPTATSCTPYYSWPVYFVQRGDTLYSLALATGSSVDELMQANCLIGTRIYVNQPLYMPHPLIFTSTYTPTIPTSTQDIFGNHLVCLGTIRQTNLYLQFSVTLWTVEKISEVTAYSGPYIEVPLMDTGGGVYSGTFGNGSYSPNSEVPYYFIAKNSLGQSIRSADYSSKLNACPTG